MLRAALCTLLDELAKNGLSFFFKNNNFIVPLGFLLWKIRVPFARGKARCDRVALPSLQYILGVRLFPTVYLYKVDCGEENSPAAPAGIRTRNLSITSPTLLLTSCTGLMEYTISHIHI